MKTQSFYLLVTPLILMLIMMCSVVYQWAEAATIVHTTVSAESNLGGNGQNGQDGQAGMDGSRGQDGQSVVSGGSHASVSVKSVINGVTIIDNTHNAYGTKVQSVVIDVSATTSTTTPMTIPVTLDNEMLTATETLERLLLLQDLLTRARNLVQLYVSMFF